MTTLTKPTRQVGIDQYLVIGNPISHSKSPLIHQLFAQQTGELISYERHLVALDGFSEAVRTFIANGGRGANVTVPFKLEAYALATCLSARAKAAGAVNTLSFCDGEICGDNTDGAGLVRDIVVNAGVAIRGSRLLLLGAGGAARGALLPLLAEDPAELQIANRSVEKAQELKHLAEQFNSSNILLSTKRMDELTGQFDVIINATSASLSSELPAISPDVFASTTFAYDMMYGDQETSFLSFARENGALTRDGLGMLIEQAAEAFYVWRGVRPQTEEVFVKLRKRENE